MSTVEDRPAVDQREADSLEVVRLVSEGKKVTDPELRRRIRERADEVRREMLERFGFTDIAVELIREARDE